MNTRLIIAIDGPSGVGKGTVAREVAAALGYRHIDTGAMYRAVAWRAKTDAVSLDDPDALTALAERLDIVASGPGVLVDGVEVGAEIRTPEIDRGASRVAGVAGVRAALVAQQRRLGAGGGVVMEGRDIGTVVFPAPR
jgi:cytidylate kinase